VPRGCPEDLDNCMISPFIPKEVAGLLVEPNPPIPQGVFFIDYLLILGGN